MNRTIKYRAWDAERKIMCYEFESLSPSMDYGVLVVGRFDKDYYELELMQYSGLKDKNGKEIYEGDIVCAYDDSALFGMGKKHQGTIIYSGNCFSLECNGVCLDKWVNAEHIKIIGNIYEHPELLKDKIQTQI